MGSVPARAAFSGSASSVSISKSRAMVQFVLLPIEISVMFQPFLWLHPFWKRRTNPRWLLPRPLLTGVWRWGLFKLPRPHCPLKGANKSGRHTHVLGGRSSHRGAWLGLAPATTPPQLPPKAEWGEGGGRVAPPAFAEAFGLVFGCHSPWGRLHPTRELYFSICLAERRRHFRPLAPGPLSGPWPPGAACRAGRRVT